MVQVQVQSKLCMAKVGQMGKPVFGLFLKKGV